MIAIPVGDLDGLGRLHRTAAPEITGVQIDSRRIEPGDLFVAVNDAGRAFVPESLGRGAAAALEPELPYDALARIAGAVRDRSGARFVGITGSVGKTSTKDILAGLCAPHRRTIAAEANFNNELGVPLTLCRVEPETEVCVLELGMRGLGQIAWLCSFARPHVGVITSIGPVHLELVGTVERVAQAKAELVEAVELAVVPEEPLLEPYLNGRAAIRRYADRDLLAFDDGRATFRVRDAIVELDLPFTARHNALNTLAALHVYDVLGLPLDDAQRGADSIELTGLRGEELPLPGGGVLINDCYNANPISMRAALAHLAARAAGRRRVAVLGDMAELGPGAPAYHREVGEAAAELGVDELVAVGELARGYVDGAGDVPSRWAPTVELGIEELERALRPGDVVLVKGSRALGLEAVAAKVASVTAP